MCTDVQGVTRIARILSCSPVVPANCSMGWRRCCNTSSIYGRSLVLLWLLFAQGRCWTARNAAITPRRPACGPRSLCCFMPVPSESCHASGSIMTKRGRTTLRRASISYVTNEPMSSSGTARDGRGTEVRAAAIMCMGVRHRRYQCKQPFLHVA